MKLRQSELDLGFVFLRCGYVRKPSLERQKKDGPDYKKGYEVRLVLYNRRELKMTRALLSETGMSAGKPFEKHSRIVQPVYGLESMKRLVAWAREAKKNQREPKRTSAR